MRGAPSPIRGAVLGLLRERPSYGYELGERLESRLGPAWNFRLTGLYSILDWLWKEGLVTKDVGEPITLRQGRRVRYQINDVGLRALDAWMAKEPEPEELRSGLIARIAVAGPQDIPTLLAHLDEAERACLAQAAAAADRRSVETWEDQIADLVAERAEVRLDGDVTWIEYARDRLLRFADRQLDR